MYSRQQDKEGKKEINQGNNQGNNQEINQGKNKGNNKGINENDGKDAALNRREDEIQDAGQNMLSRNYGPTEMDTKWSRDGWDFRKQPSFKSMALDKDTSFSIDPTTDLILSEFFQMDENGELKFDEYADKRKFRALVDLQNREELYRKDRDYYVEFPWVKGKHVNHDFFERLQKLHNLSGDPDGIDPIKLIQENRYQRFFTLGEQHKAIEQGLQPNIIGTEKKIFDSDDFREGKQFLIERYQKHLKETKEKLALESGWTNRMEKLEGKKAQMLEEFKSNSQPDQIFDHNIRPQSSDLMYKDNHLQLYSKRDQLRVILEDSLIEQDMALMEAKYKYYDRKVGFGQQINNTVWYIATAGLFTIVLIYTSYKFFYEELYVGRDYATAWRKAGMPWYEEDENRIPQVFWPWQRDSDYQKRKRAMKMVEQIREEERLKLLEEIRQEEEARNLQSDEIDERWD